MVELRSRQDLWFRSLCAKAAVALCVGLVHTHAGADLSDKVFRFSTPGIDRYADGSVVADGECYALVWSPKGRDFSGFGADGTASSPDDRVVMAAPLAKDGRCRDTLYHVSAADYSALQNGVWSVCLVDTRDASGEPTGVDENGALRRVNRWGLVGADVRPTSTADALLRRKVAVAQSTDAPSGAMAGGIRATEVSSIPDAARNLKITGIEVEDRVVALTVEGAVPYLTYDIESGDGPSALATGWAVEKKDGGGDGRILLDAWKSGRARFYRVTRAAPK